MAAPPEIARANGMKGGRPPGRLNNKTIEKNAAEQEFKNRILLSIHDLLNAQLNIARGTSYLYRIDEVKGADGKVHKEHTLVTDPIEIKDVLDEVEGTGTVDGNYYYITTKDPDNRALDSLIDRVFGKPKQSMDIDHTTKGDKLTNEPAINELAQRLNAIHNRAGFRSDGVDASALGVEVRD